MEEINNRITTSTRTITGYIINTKLHKPLYAFDIDITCVKNTVSLCKGDSVYDNLQSCYENQSNLENDEDQVFFDLEDDIQCYGGKDRESDEIDGVSGKILAIAAGASGVILIRTSEKTLDAFAPMDLVVGCRVYGVRFLSICGQEKLAVLAQSSSSRNWFMRIYGLLNGKIQAEDVQQIECPTTTTAMTSTIAADVPRHETSWRLRIATMREIIFVLGCSRSCSAIWALTLPNLKWRTVLVEKNTTKTTRIPLLMRMRPPEVPRPTAIGLNARFPISSTAHTTVAAATVKEARRSALPRILFKSRRNVGDSQQLSVKQYSYDVDGNADDVDNKFGFMPDTFTCFDVSTWRVASDFRHTTFNAETRVLLCEAAKSRLHVLRLATNGRIESRVVKTKRSKELSWIVRGPKLAVWDDKKDVLVFDASGKLFCFCGTDYRIKKVVADFGQSEITALTTHAGWCFAADADARCVHVLRYRLNTATGDGHVA